MSLNFFRTDCQYPPITLNSFGLCDNQDGTKAFPDIDPANRDLQWIAEVKNESNLEVVFTAVDNCVLQNNEHFGRGRCDGMLTTNKHLYLVELKDRDKNWQAKAKEQLISTIELLTQHHDINQYKFKKAFACNRKGKFAYVDNEENKILFRRTGFRIDIQSEILVL